MANKDFTSIEAALKFIEKQSLSVLKQEIAKATVKTMQKHIQTDVYDVYDPKQYERKSYQGGLIDQDNIEVAVVDDNTISVENIRFDGDREVAQIVESGEGYIYDFPFNGVPRPFTENTIEELKETGLLEQEMKKGLARRGFNVQ